MRDPSYWTKPTEFIPERHLKTDPLTGHINYVKSEKIVPFGVGKKSNALISSLVFRLIYTFGLPGKRVCLGESLAKMELFLMFTKLMQLFEFKAPEGKEPSDKNPTKGLICGPQPYNTVVTLRK